MPSAFFDRARLTRAGTYILFLTLGLHLALPAWAANRVSVDENNFVVSGRYELAAADGFWAEQKIQLNSIAIDDNICRALGQECSFLNDIYMKAAIRSLTNYKYSVAGTDESKTAESLVLHLRNLEIAELDNGYEVKLKLTIAETSKQPPCFPSESNSRYVVHLPDRGSGLGRVALGLGGVFIKDAKRLASNNNAPLSGMEPGSPESWQGLGQGYPPSGKKFDAIGHGVTSAMRLALVNLIYQMGSMGQCNQTADNASEFRKLP